MSGPLIVEDAHEVALVEARRGLQRDLTILRDHIDSQGKELDALGAIVRRPPEPTMPEVRWETRRETGYEHSWAFPLACVALTLAIFTLIGAFSNTLEAKDLDRRITQLEALDAAP